MENKTENLVLELKEVGVKLKTRLGLFRRHERWILRGLSLEVSKGETIGVIGRNGAGKSTLLKLIANIIAPDEGVVSSKTTSILLLALQVGFMQRLTGRENAIMSGLLLGVDKKLIEQSLGAIKEYSGLGEYFDMPLTTYSTGMRVRLGFSVAMYADPDILLLDEIMAVGDADFKAKSRDSLIEKIKSDKTVFIVSHDTKSIGQLCHRVLWIENGDVAMLGDTEEVLSHYHQAGKRQQNRMEWAS